MKYKLQPQKFVMIAGLVASTYAQACYYQTTHTFYCCSVNNETVDKITWLDNTTSPVIADGEWPVTPTHSMVYTSTGAGGAAGVANGGSALYCTGPALVYSYTGTPCGDITWMGNSVTHNYAVLAQPYYSSISANTSGGTCQ